jgi:hypothetical protein
MILACTLPRRVPASGLLHAGTVTLNRRAYSPVLRQTGLRADTAVPWWQNHRLRFQFT